jgi:hypothetical protein
MRNKVEQKALKFQLKIKRNNVAIEDAVEENFGYSPNWPWFNKMLDENIAMINEMKTLDPIWAENYLRYN